MAYIFWYDVLHEAEASTVASFLYIEPIVTVIVAAIVLNETIVPATLIGGATILLGVWLVQRTSHNEPLAISHTAPLQGSAGEQ